MKLRNISFFLCLFPLIAWAQESIPIKKNYSIQKAEGVPKIDGVLEEDFWQTIEPVSDFKQSTPDVGENASYRTEVKLAYDDEALYIAARMYDHPDSINNFLTERDQIGNADFFFVAFNTYRDGLNGEGLGVTPSGVQFDTKYAGDGESLSWDVVWETATTIDDKGWTAEFKIPWSALRFPEVEEQLWGINFGREIRRKRERSYWNFVDPTVDGFLTQTGLISGIKNIKPPVRLFFFPYASAYVENNSDNGSAFSNSQNLGMDVKYGLNDAFTVDMTLIPDFGQARFDNQVLNLSQFEVQFNENRPFFTEGVELFNKAGLFYSRRIGGRPFNRFAVNDQLDSNEVITESANQSQLLNATKLSGRTQKGLGVGFFNALEGTEFAEVQNAATEETRQIQTNPLTNYNVLVLDQIIRNNSFVTFTNTNVIRNGDSRDANVSQLDFQLADKNNRYAVSASGAISNRFEVDRTSTGQKVGASLEKISGNLIYSLSHEIITDRFNPNDLGFQTIFNNQESYGYVRYQNYSPKHFNFWRHEADVTYSRIFKPDHFANFATSWSTVYGLKSFHAFGANAGVEPIETFDFFETRTFEQYYQYPRNFWFGGFFSSDYSRPFAYDARYQQRVFDEPGRFNTRIYQSVRIRPNDKLFFVLDFTREQNENEMGYAIQANQTISGDSITMGRRDIDVHISAITANYIFNNKMALNLNLRHYWSTATYDKLYWLSQNDGSLEEIVFDEGEQAAEVLAENTSLNAFNIDLGFRWRFAPGSDINVVWKNVIFQSGDPLQRNYFREVEETINAPQINNLSIKVLYFIDYLSLKRQKE